MSEPLVSIIIPVYNAGNYIEASVQSALTQTYSNIEIIIINDGSTDDTIRVLQLFPTDRVKIINIQNAGAAAARNAGLKIAKGDYIQFLDADDLLTPNKVEAQINALDGSIDILCLCKTVQFTDGKDHLQSQPDINWYHRDYEDVVDFLLKLYAGEEIMPGYGGMIQPNAWLTSMSIIKKAGPWNEELTTDDDGEFFCRVVLASGGIKFSDRGLNYYRKHRTHQSLSGAKGATSFRSRFLAAELKYKHLKSRADNTMTDKIFARMFWWLGVEAYPQHISISKASISKAKSLGYSGEKYVGGARGHLITRFFGWKLARIISHYRHNQ